MDQKNRKQLPVPDKKQELNIKKSPTAEAMKKARELRKEGAVEMIPWEADTMEVIG